MKNRAPCFALVLTSLCGGCPTSVEIDEPFIPTEVLALRPRSATAYLLAQQGTSSAAARWKGVGSSSTNNMVLL